MTNVMICIEINRSDYVNERLKNFSDYEIRLVIRQRVAFVLGKRPIQLKDYIHFAFVFMGRCKTYAASNNI